MNLPAHTPFSSLHALMTQIDAKLTIVCRHLNIKLDESFVSARSSFTEEQASRVGALEATVSEPNSGVKGVDTLSHPSPIPFSPPTPEASTNVSNLAKDPTREPSLKPFMLSPTDKL